MNELIPVLRVLHLFVTLAMIGVVLIQRSEGGGLGIGTSQGMGSFMTGRGTANLLTRTTAILAGLFFAISLTLALLNKGTASAGRDILAPLTSAPASAPAGGKAAAPGDKLPALPALPPAPATPQVPTH